ncbi:hypothetical protein J3F83DRAFT_643965 [Trichoderma novae-zelandiae]
MFVLEAPCFFLSEREGVYGNASHSQLCGSGWKRKEVSGSVSISIRSVLFSAVLRSLGCVCYGNQESMPSASSPPKAAELGCHWAATYMYLGAWQPKRTPGTAAAAFKCHAYLFRFLVSAPPGLHLRAVYFTCCKQSVARPARLITYRTHLPLPLPLACICVQLLILGRSLASCTLAVHPISSSSSSFCSCADILWWLIHFLGHLLSQRFAGRGQGK